MCDTPNREKGSVSSVSPGLERHGYRTATQSPHPRRACRCGIADGYLYLYGLVLCYACLRFTQGSSIFIRYVTAHHGLSAMSGASPHSVPITISGSASHRLAHNSA